MLELFETIRLDVLEDGFSINASPHLDRLERSAIELGFDFDKHRTTNELARYIEENPQPPGLYKLKITLVKASKPQYSLESYTRFQDPNYIIKLKLLSPSRYHCLSNNPLTKHKTTLRGDFSDELKDCDEVIWLNERGEIAEGSYTNIFWQDLNDQWYTPALEVGILAGTMRAQILKQHSAQEGHYQADSLESAKKIIITNAMLGARLTSLYRHA